MGSIILGVGAFVVVCSILAMLWMLNDRVYALEKKELEREEKQITFVIHRGERD